MLWASSRQPRATYNGRQSLPFTFSDPKRILTGGNASYTVGLMFWL